MSIRDALIRFARQVVEGVLNTITQQLNVVENQVNQQIQSYIQSIIGGAWQGDDADRFVDELNNVVLTEVTSLLGTVQDTGQQINQAIDVLDQADERARGMVDTLGDTFRQIYQ